MIYSYEAAVIKFFESFFNDEQHNPYGKPRFRPLTMATFANEEDLLLAIKSVKKFPCFYFNRGNTIWEDNKAYVAHGGANGEYSKEFFIAKTEYQGHILCETNLTAFNILKHFRSYIQKHSTVNVPFNFPPNEEQFQEIQLRFTGFTIQEMRDQADLKGTYRDIQISWWSQIPVTDYDEGCDFNNLTEAINLWIVNDLDPAFYLSRESEQVHDLLLHNGDNPPVKPTFTF